MALSIAIQSLEPFTNYTGTLQLRDSYDAVADKASVAWILLDGLPVKILIRLRKVLKRPQELMAQGFVIA